MNINNEENGNNEIEQKILENKVIKVFAERLKPILLVCLTIIIFCPAYLRGLFFERQQFHTEIFVFVVFVLFCIYKFLKSERIVISTPLDLLSLGLALIYLISIIFAVSRQAAIEEWLKYCMYFAVFFMIADSIKSIKQGVAFLWIIIASSVGLCILGIDGTAGYHISNILNKLLGFMHWQNGVFFSLSSHGRINSTLQYSNSLAAYLLSVYFLALGLFMYVKSIIQKIIAGAASFIILMTFIFTQSRGGYLVMVITAIIFIIILPRGFRIKGCISSLISIMPTMLIWIRLSNYISSTGGNGFGIWITIIIGVILSVLISLVIIYSIKYLEKINWRFLVYGSVSFLALGAVFVIIALNVSSPLVLSHSGEQKDSSKSVIKYLALKPGTEYSLNLKLQAKTNVDKPYAYKVEIDNRTNKNILSNTVSEIKTISGKGTNATEDVNIVFKVPDESKIVEFLFSNYYKGTEVKFIKAEVYEKKSGKRINNMKLKYVFIPQSLVNRIEDTKATNSSIVRNLLTKDSIKAIEDHWLTGAGGGAWQYLYGIYQSYNYAITQTHNFYTQIWLESGIIGILLFIGVIITICLMFLNLFFNTKEKKDEVVLQLSIFIAITALLIHSAIDFDFSIPAITLLFWEMIAIYNSFFKNNKDNVKGIHNKVMFRIQKLLEFKKLSIHFAICLSAGLVLVLLSFSFSLALAYEVDSINSYKNSNIDKTIVYEKKSATFDPFKPEYKLDIANLMSVKSNVTEQDIATADEYANEAAQLGKYNAKIMSGLAAYYLRRGLIDKGTGYIESALNLNPLDPKGWESEVDSYYKIAAYYFGKGDNTKAETYINKILTMKNEAIKKNESNLIPFIFTSKTNEIIGKAKYIKDNIQNLNSIDPNKLVFYNISNLDIDSDGIPDQWNKSQLEDVKKGKNKMVIKPTSSGKSFLISDALILKPSANYQLTITFNKKPANPKLTYSIKGLVDEFTEANVNGNVYYADFSTPADLKNRNISLIINNPCEYDIQNITIFEK